VFTLSLVFVFVSDTLVIGEREASEASSIMLFVSEYLIIEVRVASEASSLMLVFRMRTNLIMDDRDFLSGGSLKVNAGYLEIAKQVK
jgi:hypothetical protein